MKVENYMCKDCFFYEITESELANDKKEIISSAGMCHRYPPKNGWRSLDIENEDVCDVGCFNDYLIDLPGTIGINWCGEFKIINPKA